MHGVQCLLCNLWVRMSDIIGTFLISFKSEKILTINFIYKNKEIKKIIQGTYLYV